MKTNRILVTGATGFIGEALCQTLHQRRYPVRMVLRDNDEIYQKKSQKVGQDVVFVPEIGPDTEWDEALESVGTVIYLAGRAHILKETNVDPLKAYRLVNTLGVKQLAIAASKIGVKRFIFISTVGVNGNQTGAIPFNEKDVVSPHNEYAISKFEAEQCLYELSNKTNMEFVIVRPPLVYGPKVKANFLRLMWLVKLGVPLPLSALKNRRSLVYLENLVDFLITCIEHSAAAGEIFFVSDGEDLSTPELILKIASKMSKPLLLFNCPIGVLNIGAKLLGKEKEIEGLCYSLQINISKAKQFLGWEAPFTVDAGLDKTVKWYLRQNHK